MSFGHFFGQQEYRNYPQHFQVEQLDLLEKT